MTKSTSSLRVPHLVPERHVLAPLPATPRRRFRKAHGTVWIVMDTVGDDLLCFWYGGAGDEDLIEFARFSNESEAVAWGRLRSSRVQLRVGSADTLWAGLGARPLSVAKSWEGKASVLTGAVAADRARLDHVRHRLDGLVSARSDYPWTAAQADEYERLCADERALLPGAAPVRTS